jgi:hypothetical protein
MSLGSFLSHSWPSGATAALPGREEAGAVERHMGSREEHFGLFLSNFNRKGKVKAFSE